MTDNLDHANNNSLYSQVGGETAVRAVVTEFYNRVLGDPALAPYFRHKQRKGLEESQVRFFTQALGGPTIYQGPSMADAHRNLHITARNFDRVADHLNETLASLGVDSAHIDAIMNTVAPLKGDIVNENSMDTTSSNSTNSGDTVLRDVDTSKSVTDSLEGIKGTMASLQANVFVADTNLNIVYINPRAAETLSTIAQPIFKTFGVRIEDILNGHIHRFHRDPKRVESILRDPKAMPHSADFNFGGVTLRTRINAVMSAEEKIIGYTVCWEDVTTELRQENEFRRVMNMVDQMPTNVFLCDRDLQIIYLNPAATATMEKLESYLPIKASELLGANIDIFHKHPEHQRRILSDPTNLPYRARINIGEEKADLLVNAIYDAEGNYVGPMLTWEIITEKVLLEERIRGTVEVLATSSEEMIATSDQMGSNAGVTSSQAISAVRTAEDINENVQAVSSGIEEMGASIKEIAKNATDAARVADEAVSIAEGTNTTISSLGTSSAEIGKVIKVITGIAQQTNLLALNATIEAARAGDAGRGFAVVANEVKELAKETGRATEDIGQKIEAIQVDVKGAIEGIARISEVIHHISQVQGSIASAVEEQTITTNEMGRRVADAAKGTNEVAGNIGGVAEAAKSTNAGVDSMRQAATDLAKLAADLQTLVVDAERTGRADNQK
ncbi:methyl-accepting chemotaxis protein [uncultured Alcanivorax sp.]|jgi:methyl-accepting chemotaxis protein|uniref:methyl-accepting chemotaxis protein n=1 Tax=uncultured Alcanivorax sp. TaxID=191215 RepID=UPI00262CF3F4|nr:methyl-accepting chemotaxis protein [uncultured Alcanivorax sp.]